MVDERRRAEAVMTSVEARLARALGDFDAHVRARDAGADGGRAFARCAARVTAETLGGSTRALCDAGGASRSITRCGPMASERELLMDEADRARGLEEIRRASRVEWARESVARGALATSEERWEEAERCFARALELDPTCVRGVVAWGACLANQRKYASALREFERALTMRPTDALALEYKRAVEEKMEKIERTRADEAAGRVAGVARAAVPEIDALRAKVVNPARGLHALGRGADVAETRSYELVGDDEGGERERKRKKEKIRRRERSKDRKKDRKGKKRSRRYSSDSSSSS